jgi:putative MATE family efflux protein
MKLLREALSSERRDYTSGDLRRAILLLAIPMVLEMAMESLFAVADIFWVSKLGADAIAAVGYTESFMTIIYAVGIGISMAATALVARRTGEKDPEAAARTAVQVVLLGVGVAAVLGVVGATFADDLLRMVGATESVVATGGGFARVMLGGNASVMLIFLINAAFRGAGDAAIAMRTLWLANAFNIVLGPCFIFGLGPLPEMGVTGAAVATTIGRSLGVGYQVYWLVKGHGNLRVARRHVAVDLAVIRQLARVAVNGIGQLMISTTSWIGLVSILAIFGSPVVAGYTVGVRVLLFALLPSWGLSNAAATLVGQNLGAKQPERAEQAVRIAARFNFWFLTAVGVVFVAFAGPIVGLFAKEVVVVEYATETLRICALGFPVYAYGVVLLAAFNGAGDTRTPTMLNFVCFWCWEIPLAYVLARVLGVGPAGVFWAICVAFSTLAVLGWVVFRRGTWKGKVV